MKIVAIVQARMGSTRLPGKVMRTINGVPMIELLLNRLSRANTVHQVVVATSCSEQNNQLVQHVRELGYECYCGSEENVLLRYIRAAERCNADVVVRITGDCPLTDPSLVDLVVTEFLNAKVDYACNNHPPTYPDGLDIEVMTTEALQRSLQAVDLNIHHREHVTPYIRNSSEFKVKNLTYSEDCSSLRWTVDEPEDFEVVSKIFGHFYPDIYFKWEDVLELERIKPQLFDANKGIKRNEGAEMNCGQKLWRRAKRIIPGGNMLLSKRPEMFLPEKWPAYFERAKGCKVWDIDGNEYVDMSLMGVGTNILGYGHPQVDEAVMRAIHAGNMSTLNCSEEVMLAERLVEIHPWADMVRFARTGGEANAIAVRLARAASGRHKIAVCGYHGWHDWYLSINLENAKGLEGHLLPGLEPNGVPPNLTGTVFTFRYNNYSELEALVSSHDIGVIVMEVVRNVEPEDGFLEKVRKLASEKGIVLIFDECTSGFRETLGGIHKKYGVVPDIAMFGKALGNGYAITALVGKREVMEMAQSTFISSTFWTERIGPTAALKTLDVMEELKSWQEVTVIGCEIRENWKYLAKKYHLEIKHWGLPSLAGYTFNSPHHLKYKTLITQEMLKEGFLAGTSVYACIQHTQEVLDKYFAALEPVFKMIAECEQGRSIYDLLEGPICHDGFKRLN